MLLTNQRKSLGTQFEKWCMGQNVPCCSVSMLVFLEGKEMLNENKVREFLATNTDTSEPLDGLKNFEV